MKSRARRTGSGIQGQGALAAINFERTLAELAQLYDVQLKQITVWKAPAG